VLESRHVIGLFMLMLLFSGVFFTLGYVMGHNQLDSPVRAATDFFNKPANSVSPKKDASSKRANNPPLDAAPTDTAAPPNSDWEFYHAGDSKKTEDHLKPVASSPAPGRFAKGHAGDCEDHGATEDCGRFDENSERTAHFGWRLHAAKFQP